MQIFLFLFCQEERNWVCVLSLIWCTKHCKQAQIEITLSIWADDDDECTMRSLFMICIQKILLVIFFLSAICQLLIEKLTRKMPHSISAVNFIAAHFVYLFIMPPPPHIWLEWINMNACSDAVVILLGLWNLCPLAYCGVYVFSHYSCLVHLSLNNHSTPNLTREGRRDEK